MKAIIQKNIRLYLLLLLYFIIGGVSLFFFEKGNEVALLNRLHNSVFDVFFKYWSGVGNGWFNVIAIALIYPINKYKFIILAVNSTVCGLLAQLLKRSFFMSYDRPIKLLGEHGYRFVDGVDVASKHSFPSGHTVSAFALFMMLALLFDDKKPFFMFFLAAFLVGVARVYLFQHFYIDTYFGALLAVIVSTIVYYILSKHPRFENKL